MLKGIDLDQVTPPPVDTVTARDSNILRFTYRGSLATVTKRLSSFRAVLDIEYRGARIAQNVTPTDDDIDAWYLISEHLAGLRMRLTEEAELSATAIWRGGR